MRLRGSAVPPPTVWLRPISQPVCVNPMPPMAWLNHCSASGIMSLSARFGAILKLQVSCLLRALFCLIACAITGGSLRAKDFIWAQRAGGSGNDVGRDITVDSAGHCYVTGWFQGQAAFGPQTLTSDGGFDLFLAKFDSAGKLLWLRQGGGVENSFGTSVACDKTGNAYIAGQFSGKLRLGDTELTASGVQNIFLAKFDAAGTFQWAKRFGTRNDFVNALAIDAIGNCYLAGYFSASTSIGATELTSSGQVDVFTAKLDSSGQVLWATKGGGAGVDIAQGIAVDSEGRVFVTGSFQTAATFGGEGLTAAGASDIFVASYDGMGRLRWVKRAGGNGVDEGRSIAVDQSGHCYLTGYFSGVSSFDDTQIPDTGVEHLFVAKLNSEGQYDWVKSLPQTRAFGFDLAVSSAGPVYVVGPFNGTVLAGGISLVSKDNDLLVAKFAADGGLVWANRAGGDRSETGFGIAVNSAGEPYVAGFFTSQTAEFGCTALVRSGVSDEIFVAKLAAVSAILTSPKNQAVMQGSRVQLTVEAASDSAEYQWQRNGQAIAGATSSALTIDSAQPADAGEYRVLVTVYGCAFPSAAANLTVNEPPAFVTQPGDQVTETGSSLTLSAAVTGTGPLSFYWFFNETNLLNVTSPTSLVLSNVTLLDSGTYSVLVSNAFATATSRTAAVLVQPRGAPRVSANGQTKPRFTFVNVDPVEVRLETTMPGATMFFTLDGTMPNASSTLYTGPFEIHRTVEVRAIAYDRNFVSALGGPIPIRLARTYNLEIRTEGGGQVTLDPPGGVYDEGASVTVRAAPEAGWSFLGWNGAVGGTDSVLSLRIERALNFEAIFGTTLVLQPVGSGRIEVTPQLDAYRYGARIRVTAIPEDGHYFGLWGGSAFGVANPLSFSLTNASPKISALFAPLATNQVALTALSLGKGSLQVEPTGNVFAKGSSVTITGLPEEGRRFLFWSGDAQGNANPLQTVLDRTKVVRAHFTGGTNILFTSAVSSKAEGIRLSLSTDTARVALEASTNLVNWTELATLTNLTGTVEFLEPGSGDATVRFYRAVGRD